MIRRVTVRHFKRFEEEVFDLSESVVLAGANDSGKTTLLQAISTWKFGLDRWLAHRDEGRAKARTAATITRAQFTPVPVREFNLLWAQRATHLGSGHPRRIEIEIEGETDGRAWRCGMDFQYQSPEVMYARPMGIKDLDDDQLKAFPPLGAEELALVHVPALGGVAREEQRHDRGMQDLFVGQGRTGEILRNLLLEISTKAEDWSALQAVVEGVLGIQLERPLYAPADAYIRCEYRTRGHRRPLDLSSAGTGALQVILLFAFLHARRGAVVLMDEPDAHQHVMRQKQVVRRIREVISRRGGQLIAATHSEVVLNAAEPSEILGFFSTGPRALTTSNERRSLVEALQELEISDLLRARECGAILYVEDESDEDLLREWARILDHPAKEFFALPNTCRLHGRLPKKARRHFSLLRIEFPELPGVCLLDGNNRDGKDEGDDQAGFRVLQWKRYEIENYLLHPDAIKRFVERSVMANPDEVAAEFRRQLPEGTDIFGDHAFLAREKGSDNILIPMLERAGRRTKKADLYQLAAVMRPEEIHREVKKKLDRIAEKLLPKGSA